MVEDNASEKDNSVMWTTMMIDRSDLFLDEKERLMGQAEVTKGLWQDEVQERFYERFVDKAILSVDQYLDGSDGYIGMGLRDLTTFVNTKISEFNSL